MICKLCNHANSDEQARRGRVQKCDLCHKVIYIPSGLHSAYYEPNQARYNTVEKQGSFAKFVFNLQDLAAANFSKLWRSKAKWIIPLFLLAMVAGFALSNTVFKSKVETKAVADSPAMNYYQKVLPLRGAVTTTIDNFRITAGDKPDKTNFNYWRNPNNKERFVRACDDTIKSIENTITQLRVLKDQGYVPPEAVVHQNALLEMLYARQMYYARLKDGLNNNDQNLWNTAFDLKDKMNDTFSAENGALENLRDLVFNSKNAGK
jgi:hypothetical protein